MILTLYFEDENGVKNETYFEFRKEELDQFLSKLYAVQDVCFISLLNSFI
jgi:hypothetical protein